MNQYFLQLNGPKTQISIFGPKRVIEKIKIKGVNLPGEATVMFISTVKNLGAYMDSHLTLDSKLLS